MWWFVGGMAVGGILAAVGFYVWVIKNIHPWQ
jgi:di/tricarboxylate transporter